MHNLRALTSSPDDKREKLIKDWINQHADIRDMVNSFKEKKTKYILKSSLIWSRKVRQRRPADNLLSDITAKIIATQHL